MCSRIHHVSRNLTTFFISFDMDTSYSECLLFRFLRTLYGGSDRLRSTYHSDPLWLHSHSFSPKFLRSSSWAGQKVAIALTILRSAVLCSLLGVQNAVGFNSSTISSSSFLLGTSTGFCFPRKLCHFPVLQYHLRIHRTLFFRRRPLQRQFGIVPSSREEHQRATFDTVRSFAGCESGLITIFSLSSIFVTRNIEYDKNKNV